MFPPRERYAGRLKEDRQHFDSPSPGFEPGEGVKDLTMDVFAQTRRPLLTCAAKASSQLVFLWLPRCSQGCSGKAHIAQRTCRRPNNPRPSQAMAVIDEGPGKAGRTGGERGRQGTRSAMPSGPSRGIASRARAPSQPSPSRGPQPSSALPGHGGVVKCRSVLEVYMSRVGRRQPEGVVWQTVLAHSVRQSTPL